MNLKAIINSPFGADGYIEDQSFYYDIKNGIKPLSYNGCGPVSVYNLFKALGFKKDFLTIVKELRKGLVLGGKLGTSGIFIFHYLKKSLRNNSFYISFTCSSFFKQNVKCGILYYLRKNFTAHFVCFTYVGTNDNGLPVYSFHNSDRLLLEYVNVDEKTIIKAPEMTMDRYFDAIGPLFKIICSVL